MAAVTRWLQQGYETNALAAAEADVPSDMPKFDQLTKREREVFALIAEGATNPQIARALRLSLKTVQNYVSRILDKLQIANRTQAALRARGYDQVHE